MCSSASAGSGAPVAEHFIRQCECGRVLAQCRCPAPDKRVDIVSPCQCPPNTRPAFTSGGTNDGPQSEGAESETPDSALGSASAPVTLTWTLEGMIAVWAQARGFAATREDVDALALAFYSVVQQVAAQLAGGSRG